MFTDLIRGRVRRWLPVVLALLLPTAGCLPEPPAPLPKPLAGLPDAPAGDAIADPALRQARAAADAALGDLLAGRPDDDTNRGEMARRLRGYGGYAVKEQWVIHDGAVEVRGVFTGADRPARFAMTLFRQPDGSWQVGMYSGAEPE